jgi:hypothetical protein
MNREDIPKVGIDVFIHAFRRSFSGLDERLNRDLLVEVLDKFMAGDMERTEIENKLKEFHVLTCIHHNILQTENLQNMLQRNLLNQCSARHIMVIVEDDTSWQILFDNGTLDRKKTEIVFGSSFVNDRGSKVCIIQCI